MKKYNYYSNDLDKAWYDSSNVFYSECDDKNNELKVVRITFSNGNTYQYTDVEVNDYLLFREASSQGQALNKYIKKYPYEKLEAKDIGELEKELQNYLLLANNLSVEFKENEVYCYAGQNLIDTIEITEENKTFLEKFAKIMHINILKESGV